MAANGCRLSAVYARIRASQPVLLMLSLLMLSGCASHAPSPAAAKKSQAEGVMEQKSDRIEVPQMAAPSDDDDGPMADEPKPVAKPQPEVVDAAPAATPEAQPTPIEAPEKAEVVTDAAVASPATPQAPVQPEPDQLTGAEPGTADAPLNTHPCARADSADDMIVDNTRQLLEEQTCKAALWLDGLFGKVGDAEAARRTRGFLELSNVYSQFEGFDSRARLHIEFDLPVAKNQLSAFVGRENDEDFVRGRTDASELRATFPTLSEQNQWLAGLGYSLPDTSNTQTSVRVGVRGLGPPTAFVQGQLRYTLYADDDDVAYVKSTPFWNTRDRAGVTQSFDYSHVLSKHYLARWYSVGTISQRSKGLNWRNSAILYHNLENKRGLAYEAFIRGETDEPEPLYEYGGRVLFRHPFLGQKLFAEWAAGYSFPRTDPNKPRNGSANVGLSIDLPFGDPRD
jgi:hypothetical protein